MNPLTPEYRTDLAKILINIFRVSEISDADATVLLGYSGKNYQLIKGLKAGKPLTNRVELIDRAGLLIRLHYSLSDLYDNDFEKCSTWLASPQISLDNLSPIECMKQHGVSGIKQVVGRVEKANGRS